MKKKKNQKKSIISVINQLFISKKRRKICVEQRESEI